jgi:hypothetical protein
VKASPYDRIAELYDPWSRSVVEDVGFYVAEAAKSGGRWSSSESGPGRIAIPIAETGKRVIGVDSSREMLAACRRRAEEAGVAELLDLRLGDLRHPPLDEKVPLVICPFRSYLHLADDGDRAEALGCGAQHARPRRAPDLRRLRSRRRRHRGHPWPLARARAGDLRAGGLGHGYADADALGQGPRRRRDDGALVDLRGEWIDLLEEAEFVVEACYGWFDRTPHRGGEDMIFVARRL